MVVLHAAALAALVVLTSACGREHGSTEHIELTAASLDEAIPPTLKLRGRDFPLGAACEIELRGTRFRPDRGKAHVTETLPCSVLDATLTSASIDAAPLSTRAPFLFEGAIELRLEAAGRQLAGSLGPVVLRIRGSAETELALARAARSFQHALGILAVEATAHGLTIVQLDAKGVAARAGVRAGDVARRLNGAPIELASDLAGDPGKGSLRLSLMRAEDGAERPLEVVLAGESRVEEVWRLALLGVLGAACAALLPALSRIRRRAAESATRTRGLLAMISLLGACLLVGQELDLRTLWLLPTALHVMALALAHAKRELSTAALSRETLHLALATLGAAALRLASFADPQALPWQWAVATTPSTWLAALVLAHSEDKLRLEDEQSLLTITTPWLAYARAAVLASFALGASATPIEWALEGRALTLVSALVFLGKVELARWLLARLARIRLTAATKLGCALSAPLVALAWSHWLGESALPTMLGAIVAGVAVGRIARTLMVRVLGTTSVRDPALSPLL